MARTRGAINVNKSGLPPGRAGQNPSAPGARRVAGSKIGTSASGGRGNRKPSIGVPAKGIGLTRNV